MLGDGGRGGAVHGRRHFLFTSTMTSIIHDFFVDS
jgi:hypothetical protein